MGLLRAVGKFATNVGKTVKKAGSDAVSEVKRHPVIYGGLALGGLGMATGVLPALAGKVFGHGSTPTDASGQTEDQFYNSTPGTTGYNGPSEGTGGGGNPLLSVGKGPIPKNADGSIDYGSLLKTGIGAGTAYEGYKANQQANDLRAKGLDAATQQYTANAPLRAQAMQGLQTAQRPDLSPIFDDGNPYKKKPTIPSSLMTVGRRPLALTPGGYSR